LDQTAFVIEQQLLKEAN